MSTDEAYYIALSPNPIKFEPVSRITSVFFDDSNGQVFAVRSAGATGVVVKGPHEKCSKSFRMEDRGEVISIKFSLNMKILAIQRSHKSVEFVNFSNDIDSVEYSQVSKGKSTKIIGFNWTSASEIVFVTDNGLEYYQVNPEKRSLKLLKSFGISVNWYVWLPESSALLLSSGNFGNILHPFIFKEPQTGQIVKLPKFEVDIQTVPTPPKLCLFERDVTMAKIYEQLYIIILRHQPKSSGTAGTEIVLYAIQKESPANRTHILKLNIVGRFAINIIDNLIVVHHQASKTSILFDIRLQGGVMDSIVLHYPVLPPLPMKPFKLQIKDSLFAASASDTLANESYSCDLYSSNWIVFQPDIIIDAKLGYLWSLQILLEPLVSMMSDKIRLIDFLLQRRNSKHVIITVCCDLLSTYQQSSLATIAKIFDKLNSLYKQHSNTTSEPSSSTASHTVSKNNTLVIDQSDMYTHVFSPLDNNKKLPFKFFVAVLIEYVRSLNSLSLPVQHYMYELIINILIQNNQFYQLHQFLQYHLLNDSKPLACLLLSLESIYPKAYQLALDMLQRLPTANEEIIEVLLSKQQVLQALRFSRSVGLVDSISARKYLECAFKKNDKIIFYTVYKFFQQRNSRLRSNPKFAPGEHCDKYTDHFVEQFGSASLDN